MKEYELEGRNVPCMSILSRCKSKIWGKPAKVYSLGCEWDFSLKKSKSFSSSYVWWEVTGTSLSSGLILSPHLLIQHRFCLQTMSRVLIYEGLNVMSRCQKKNLLIISASFGVLKIKAYVIKQNARINKWSLNVYASLSSGHITYV